MVFFVTGNYISTMAFPQYGAPQYSPMSQPMGQPMGYPAAPMGYPAAPPSESNTLLYVVVGVAIIVLIYLYTKSKKTSVAPDDTPTTPPPVTADPAVDPNAPTCADPTAYYYYFNPDVKAAGVDALAHWNAAGYKEGRKSCWPFPTASGTASGPRAHTDRLTSDGVGGRTNLLINEAVYSPARSYYLTLDSNGNAMTLNATSGKVTWQSGSGGKGGVTMNLQTDGNLVIYANDGKAVWSWGSNTASTNLPLDLNMQDDGNLVLYSRKTGKALKDTQ
jgi:hypothetical protein